MGAQPKKKQSKSRSRKRRWAHKMEASYLSKCPNCGELKRPHMVCLNCGHFKGQKII